MDYSVRKPMVLDLALAMLMGQFAALTLLPSLFLLLRMPKPR